MIANAGQTILLLFNVTSSRTGALYFYASAIPAPGEHWDIRLQNVTDGNVKLPPGVKVSFPSGQAVFGTNHGILALRIELLPDLTGRVGLVVGAFQQLNQEQVVGIGRSVYLTVLGK
jgi:hypothetical protein